MAAANASSADLRERAGQLEDERSSLTKQLEQLESDYADVMFAGEGDKAADIKKKITEAVRCMQDVDHALKGSERAIAVATTAEGEVHRKELVTRYNAALRRGQDALDRLMAAVDDLPPLGQTAIAEFDAARVIFGELFATDPTAAPVKCPGQPGRFLRDLFNNTTANIYGRRGSPSFTLAARNKLSELSRDRFLPEDDPERTE
jgi:hypothetical protein